MFDHLLFGANVDGVGSRTHASLCVYARALCIALVNREDILLVRCSEFNHRAGYRNPWRRGGVQVAADKEHAPTLEVYIRSAHQGYHAPGLENFACGARAARDMSRQGPDAVSAKCGEAPAFDKSLALISCFIEIRIT